MGGARHAAASQDVLARLLSPEESSDGECGRFEPVTVGEGGGDVDC